MYVQVTNSKNLAEELRLGVKKTWKEKDTHIQLVMLNIQWGLYLITIYDFVRRLNLVARVNVVDACLFDTHVRLESHPHNPV